MRYPITLADFLIADVTDSMLDGYIGGFPNTYASKVGKVCSRCALICALRFWDALLLYTSDAMYKGCVRFFVAYRLLRMCNFL